MLIHVIEIFEKLLGSEVVGIFLRCFGLLLALPISSGVAGILQKIPLAVALTALFFSGATTVVTLSAEGMVIELCYGVFLGLPTAFVVACAEQYGELFDCGRGQTIASAFDPLQEQVASISGILFKQYLWATLLVSGVLERNFGALHASFLQIAPGAVQLHQLSTWGYRALLYWAEMLCGLAVGFLPLGVGFLLVEILHGFVGKFLPGVSLSSEAFLLRSAAGYILCFFMLRLSLAEPLLTLAVPVGFFNG